MKFTKIDKDGVWFDDVFFEPKASDKARSGKITLKLKDYSQLKNEVLTTEIDSIRMTELINKGVLEVISIEYYN